MFIISINESKKCLQETEKEDKIFSDEARKFKDNIKTLEGTDAILSDTIQRTRAVLQSERKQNVRNQDWILEQEKSIENLKHLTSINISELSEVEAALEETRVTEGKLKAELEQVQEDNAQLQTKKEQLQQKVVGYQKEHAELSELIKPIEMFEKDLEEALTQRVNDIDVSSFS
ncbi:transport and Golgi organization protein 1 homolog [Trichechus manatus latirostris]|uniref:Transport and Golgi organization protein 1 homolog n=1 Tax=Trichechus manatus latirostris TaxID=127582 RepID=A0A2Y9QKV0_TRIMA|nr:transport and Golgi organization protein 1 homolog [Trichechus manatus latirostris]